MEKNEYVKVEFWFCRGDRGMRKDKFKGLNIKEAYFDKFVDADMREELRGDYMEGTEYEEEEVDGSEIHKSELIDVFFKNVVGWAGGEGEVEVEKMEDKEYMWWEGEEEVVVVAHKSIIQNVLGKLLLNGDIQLF